MEHLNYQRFLFLVLLSLKGFKTVLAGVSCSFDQGWCGWNNELASDFLWKSGFGQTDDRSSGPLNDHTCNNIMGKYIYITGHDVKTKNSTAVVRSPVFSLDKISNLTFWYSMNGVGIGHLILSKWTERQKTELWKREGRQRRDWIQGLIQLQPGKMSLEFSATVRLHYGSDLALDDIFLETDAEPKDFDKADCKVRTTSSTSTTTSATSTTITTPTTQVTTTVPPSSRGCCAACNDAEVVLPGTCDFEKDVCGNKVSSYGRFMPITWKRTDEKQQYGLLRIEGDHTKNDDKTSKGYYMQFQNGFPLGEGKFSASIATPLITRNSICLTFWYNMPSNYSNLNVSVEHGNIKREIWKRETVFSGTFLGWHKVVLTIKQEPPFSIIFQTYNKNHMAYVGIDDIVILGINQIVPTPAAIVTLSQSWKSNNVSTLKTDITRKSTSRQASTASTVPSTFTNVANAGTITYLSTVSQTVISSFPITPSTTLRTTNAPAMTNATTTLNLSTSNVSTVSQPVVSSIPKTPSPILKTTNAPSVTNAPSMANATVTLNPSTPNLSTFPQPMASSFPISPSTIPMTTNSPSMTNSTATLNPSTSNLSAVSQTVISSFPVNQSITLRTTNAPSMINATTTLNQSTTNLSTVPMASSFSVSSSRMLRTTSSPSMTNATATLNPSTNNLLTVSQPVVSSFPQTPSPIMRTTNAPSMTNATNTFNATQSMKTAKPGYFITHTTVNGSPNNSLTRHWTEQPKGTKKMNSVSTTEQSTKKVKQTTNKPNKQTEDEQQQQNDNSNNSDSGLSSLEIAAITIGAACVILITTLTIHFLLPKLRNRENRPNETSSHVTNSHAFHGTNNLSIVSGQSEHKMDGLNVVDTNIYRTNLGTMSDTVDVERISFSTKL